MHTANSTNSSDYLIESPADWYHVTGVIRKYHLCMYIHM